MDGQGKKKQLCVACVPSLQAQARVQLAKADLIIVPTAAYNYTVRELMVRRAGGRGREHGDDCSGASSRVPHLQGGLASPWSLIAPKRIRRQQRGYSN